MALPVLKEGAAGHHVRIMQALLSVHVGAHAGDKDVFIDGHFGPGTARVLREWQGRTGRLAADGTCGPATWAWLVGI